MVVTTIVTSPRSWNRSSGTIGSRSGPPPDERGGEERGDGQHPERARREPGVVAVDQRERQPAASPPPACAARVEAGCRGVARLVHGEQRDGAQSSPSGTFTQKTADQPKASTAGRRSQAGAEAEAAHGRPSRSRRLIAARGTLRPGSTASAAIPPRRRPARRAARSARGVGGEAQPSDASVNTTRPARKMRRAAVAVAQHAADQDQRRQRQRVRVEDPLEVGAGHRARAGSTAARRSRSSCRA